MSQLLVVGLGNITHPMTRHSIGHLILDSLAWRLGRTFQPHPVFDGFYLEAKGHFSAGPRDLILYKPRPAMNILGKSVYRMCRGTVNDPRRMLVVHDCLYRSPGQVKLTEKISPEGHRGIRNVNSAFYGGQPESFYRLQVGIGNNDNVANRDFVLAPLSKYEKEHYSVNGEGIDEVWALIEEAALRGDEYRAKTPMKRPLP